MQVEYHARINLAGPDLLSKGNLVNLQLLSFKKLFSLKRAFQAAYFEVSMVKIGPQTIGGIYQSLSPIKTAESESHAASSMRYQNTDLYISFLLFFLNFCDPTHMTDFVTS